MSNSISTYFLLLILTNLFKVFRGKDTKTPETRFVEDIFVIVKAIHNNYIKSFLKYYKELKDNSFPLNSMSIFTMIQEDTNFSQQIRDNLSDLFIISKNSILINGKYNSYVNSICSYLEYATSRNPLDDIGSEFNNQVRKKFQQGLKSIISTSLTDIEKANKAENLVKETCNQLEIEYVRVYIEYINLKKDDYIQQLRGTSDDQQKLALDNQIKKCDEEINQALSYLKSGTVLTENTHLIQQNIPTKIDISHSNFPPNSNKSNQNNNSFDEKAQNAINTSLKQAVEAKDNSSISGVVQVSGSINNSTINIGVQPSKTSNTINSNQSNSSLLSILEARKQDLINDISAAYKQLGTSLSEVDKTRINRLIASLESELTHIEIKISRNNETTIDQSFSQPPSSINYNVTSERKNMNKIKILFLAANPDNTTTLKLDQEFRDIKERIKGSSYRDNFELIHQPALRINDLQSTLLENNPHIVHFSGHGNNAGEIILQNNQNRSEAVNPTALAELFEILSGKIRCIVLNACFSLPQAQAISQHIDCVVGMSDSISDSAAIDFAWSFYQSLANDQDIHTSFRLGCNQLSFHNINEKNVPQLLSKPGVDPKSIKLLNF